MYILWVCINVETRIHHCSVIQSIFFATKTHMLCLFIPLPKSLATTDLFTVSIGGKSEAKSVSKSLASKEGNLKTYTLDSRMSGVESRSVQALRLVSSLCDMLLCDSSRLTAHFFLVLYKPLSGRTTVFFSIHLLKDILFWQL